MSKGKRRRNLAQRVALYLFVTAAWAVLAGSEYSSLRDARNTALQTARTNTLNLASSLAQHTSDSFAIAETVLSGVVAGVESGQLTPQTLHDALRDEVDRSDRVHVIVVYDAHGHAVNSSLPAGAQHRDVSDPASFAHHRHHDDRLALLSGPIRSPADGAWIVPLTRRLNKPDGSFDGVVLVGIPLAYFVRFHRMFDTGHGGSIAIVDDDGIVVSRYPGDAGGSGGSIAGTPFHRTMLRLRRGWISAVSPIDGVERISGFAHAQRYPFWVVIGMSTDEVLAPWRAVALRRSCVALLACALFIGLGMWLDQQLRRMQASETRLSTEAWNDPLTGLYNRRGFDYKLHSALQQSAAVHASVALLMIDVDHFKRYNDTYGHVNGDACLRQVGQALAACAQRPHDVAARYGGEEFAIVLPFTDQAGAQTLAQQVRVAVRDLDLPHASSPTDARVTVSIGIASVGAQDQHRSAAGLIGMADAALYRAKQAGRDRFST
ncbi:diguanylate cyclase domain-containing protein [Xanthomonas bundabergensis]|uniref:GGDEF domain-containing protein n=1 Tax=Xanthomonas bundabergensis TaxID=3160842 RepID=UPI00351282D7